MTGYDLSRSYQRALQQVWYAPLGQVYPTLRKMKIEGLLRVSVQVQHDRPNRKVYSLTGAGRRVFVDWLSRPATLPNMHHEFIHKLFLLNHIDAASGLRLVEAYSERCKGWAAELRRVEQKLEAALSGPHGESAWCQLLSLQHLCRIVECEAGSARRIAAVIRAKLGSKSSNVTAPARRRSPVAAGSDVAFAGLALPPTNPGPETHL